LGIKHKNHLAALSVFTVTYLIGMALPALAQDVAKSPEKWRPKDGAYTVPAEHSADEPPCEVMPDFLVKFRKKEIVGGEAFNCKIKKLTDVTKDAIRLDLSCDEDGSGGDPNDIHWQKEIMTLRKIDEKSFFMHMTKQGKFSWPEWRLSYWPAPKGC
jgi:hypothetical protein